MFSVLAIFSVSSEEGVVGSSSSGTVGNWWPPGGIGDSLRIWSERTPTESEFRSMTGTVFLSMSPVFKYLS